MDVHLSVSLAALGGQVTIPILKGEKEVEVKKGTQAGDVMVLRGSGVLRLDGRGRGDQVVRFIVDVPKDLSSRAESLLRELADELVIQLVHEEGHFLVFQRSRRK